MFHCYWLYYITFPFGLLFFTLILCFKKLIAWGRTFIYFCTKRHKSTTLFFPRASLFARFVAHDFYILSLCLYICVRAGVSLSGPAVQRSSIRSSHTQHREYVDGVRGAVCFKWPGFHGLSLGSAPHTQITRDSCRRRFGKRSWSRLFCIKEEDLHERYTLQGLL